MFKREALVVAVEDVVELLGEGLGVVQELECGEVRCSSCVCFFGAFLKKRVSGRRGHKKRKLRLAFLAALAAFLSLASPLFVFLPTSRLCFRSAMLTP